MSLPHAEYTEYAEWIFEHEAREFLERLQWQRRVAPWCDRVDYEKI